MHDSTSNPFCRFDLPHFNHLAGHIPWSEEAAPLIESTHLFKSIDATLNVPGLPQSGTGQATLFTGVNCAELAGKHFGPYPHSKTKSTIADANVFKQVNDLYPQHTEPTAFANAYPQRFFDAAEAKNRWTVTTLSCINAGVRIRTLEDLEENDAITADITRKSWPIYLNIPVDVINEQSAATHLKRISNQHRFTLFEYYLTDKVGHSQSFPSAKRILSSLNAFFGHLLSILNFENTLLLITSDHGNIEDLSIKTHTFNKVPLIAMGKGAHFFEKANSLIDVTPAIVSALQPS